MTLPFTHDAFLEVFAAFNRALWPAIAALWIATAWTAWRWRLGDVGGRALWGLLAVHWLWSGVAYHWLAFRDINPAAAVFAAAFVAQAIAFAALAVAGRAVRRTPDRVRAAVGDALIVYGLVYPAVGLATGMIYPAMPAFGVPCPTTIVTAGWLCAADAVPRGLLVIPLLWAVIGSSAALTLGVRADVALVVAAAVLVITGLRRPRPAMA